MRRKGISFTLSFFIIVSLILPCYINKAKADPVMLIESCAGNFIPVKNSSFSLTNANVIFNINYSKSSNNLFVRFNGNYTIYNPHESVRMTLAAPFSPDLINLELTCIIKLDGNVIPFNFSDRHLNFSLFNEYYSKTKSFPRKLLLINIDFPENDSIHLEYVFDAYIKIKNFLYSDTELLIYYDVGTSRAWNGTITERVEFNVYGDQPHSYLNSSESYHNYKFSISDIDAGKSYIWEWKNEVININSVYISYRYHKIWPVGFGPYHLLILNFVLVGIILLTVIGILLRKRIERENKKKFIG